MKFLTGVILTPLLLLVSCSACNTSSPKKSVVVVLCDTSNSITGSNKSKAYKTQLDVMKDVLRRLPRLYCYGSRFFFYPISSDRTDQSIVPEISYSAQFKSQVVKEKIRIDSLQDRLAVRLDSIAPVTPNSCIISSIKMGVDKLQQLANNPGGNDYKYELVIVSDMMEDCVRTGDVKIEMRLNDTAKFNKAITDLGNEDLKLDANNPAFNVWVILTSPNMDDRIDIIKRSWNNCFSRTGINKERLRITEGIPQTAKVIIN